jgi:hypothetical protein
MVVHKNQKWLDGPLNLSRKISTFRQGALGKMLIIHVGKEILRQKKNTALGKKRPGKRNAQAEGMPRQEMPRRKKYPGKRDAQAKEMPRGKGNAQAEGKKCSGRRNTQAKGMPRGKGNAQAKGMPRQKKCPGKGMPRQRNAHSCFIGKSSIIQPSLVLLRPKCK